MPITGDSIVSQVPDLVSTELDGYTMLMNVEAGRYYSLDPVAGRIWQLLEQPAPLRDVCAALEQEFEVTPERCEQDVLGLVERLGEAELVRIER